MTMIQKQLPGTSLKLMAKKKDYHPPWPSLGECEFPTRETASIQEAGRSLVIGPHPSSYLDSNDKFTSLLYSRLNADSLVSI